jgi:hypothetical protein
MVISRYYPGIFLEGLRKTTKNIRTISVRSEIRTDLHQNISEECHCNLSLSQHFVLLHNELSAIL